MKKGQISIFILMGVLLLIVLVMLYSFRPEAEAPVMDFSSEALKSYIQQCLDDSAREALQYVSDHGGYHDLEGVASNSGHPYCNDAMPTLENVEESISTKMEELVMLCFDDFKVFPGKEISYDAPSVDVAFTDSVLVAAMNVPVTYKTDNGIERIQTFATSVDNVRLPALLSFAAVFKEQPPMSYQVFQQANDQGIRVMVYNNDRDSVIVVTEKGDQTLTFAYRL